VRYLYVDSFSSIYPGKGPLGDPGNGNFEVLKKARRIGWNLEELQVVFL
jgi:hypothetical protein